ncbi:carboxyltransferase domain-containing protein [Paenarthrobacter sp. S56]|uniref:carboxyltransferase domain-containing protein n=1 Tax=Paenarthrobacter sp. S56 TaxID=3138179 RepID=UPI003218F13C
MAHSGPAVVASEPGRLLVELPQPDLRGTRLTAFIEALQSVDLVGVSGLRKLRDGVIVDYEVGTVNPNELMRVLRGAFSKARYALGEHSPSTHELPVDFGGHAGPDLCMASILLNLPEKTLVRRLCRTKHTVKTFATPGTSALFEVPWAADWHQNALSGRTMQAVPRGSLTLSPLGVTCTNSDSFSNELVVGRVQARLPEVWMGDSVWLRAANPSLANYR